MSERTPNYVLISGVVINTGRYGVKSIPAGAYVRPIELQYVPQHVLDKYDEFSKKTHVFIYTHYGFTITEKSNIREN